MMNIQVGSLTCVCLQLRDSGGFAPHFPHQIENRSLWLLNANVFVTSILHFDRAIITWRCALFMFACSFVQIG